MKHDRSTTTDLHWLYLPHEGNTLPAPDDIVVYVPFRVCFGKTLPHNIVWNACFNILVYLVPNPAPIQAIRPAVQTQRVVHCQRSDGGAGPGSEKRGLVRLRPRTLRRKEESGTQDGAGCPKSEICGDLSPVGQSTRCQHWRRAVDR